MFISFLFVVDGVDTTCSCTVYHDAHTKPGRGPGRARARITRRADYNDPAMCYLKLSLYFAGPCLVSPRVPGAWPPRSTRAHASSRAGMPGHPPNRYGTLVPYLVTVPEDGSCHTPLQPTPPRMHTPCDSHASEPSRAPPQEQSVTPYTPRNAPPLKHNPREMLSHPRRQPAGGRRDTAQ